MMYKLISVENVNVAVIQIETGKTVPLDPANTDYQEYLKWLAEGNTPEPADEVGA